MRQTSTKTIDPHSLLVSLLSFLSGTCGISYEILYARLLNVYLGDMFYVSGAILSVFLLGLAVGASFAHRFVKKLWVIELVIGGYALCFATWFGFSNGLILETITPYAASGPHAVVALVFTFLFIPSFLIGTAVPLFSLYIDGYKKSLYEAFSNAYLFYNLGAVLLILVLEFVLLRLVGTQAAIYFIALVNMVIGLTLRFNAIKVPDFPDLHQAVLGWLTDWKNTPFFAMFVLFAMSVFSGIYQLLFLKLSSFLFGPYNENFTLVVAVTLSMIAASVAFVRKFSFSFKVWIALSGIVITLNFLLLGPVFRLWGFLNGPAEHTLGSVILSGGLNIAFFGIITAAILGSAFTLVIICFLLRKSFSNVVFGRWKISGVFYVLAVLAVGTFLLLSPIESLAAHNYNTFFSNKLFVMFFLGGATLFMFGGTIPAVYQIIPSRKSTTGYLLALSSIGNVTGYLLMILVLDSQFSYHGMAFAMSLSVFVFGLFLLPKQTKILIPYCLTGLALLSALHSTWPHDMIKMGALALSDQNKLNKALVYYNNAQEYKKYGYNVGIIQSPKTKDSTLILDGYWSLNIEDNILGNIHEVIVGTIPALFAPTREKALVLGAGTGITASATQALFDDVDVVEINPIIVDKILPLYSDQNENLLEQEHVNVVLQDGMVFMADGQEKYDTIISTVTTPLFFSSSKLYTTDFFNIVKKRLKPQGVYSMWFDGRVGDDGARIIFQTIKNSFKDCKFSFLSTTYVNIVCSNEKINVQPGVNIPENLTRRLELAVRSLDVNTFLQSIIFPANVIFERDWEKTVNSFNLRTLEYAMSREDPENNVSNIFSWVEGGIRIEERQAVNTCLALRILGDRSCIEAYRLHKGHYPLDYIDLARRQTILSPEWFEDAIQMSDDLKAMGQPEEALAILVDFENAHGRKLHKERYRSLMEKLVIRKLFLYRQINMELPEKLLNQVFAFLPFNLDLKNYLVDISTEKTLASKGAHQKLLHRMLEEIGDIQKQAPLASQPKSQKDMQEMSFIFYTEQ